jgi:iron complex transport system substrate-binding protein
VETVSESERQAAQEAQYGSCLSPTGCVTFDQSPSTWVSHQYGYGDMGVALGQTDGYLATNRPENYPDFFYEELPGVSFDAGSLTDINAGDKELFFELDPDLLLKDPNNAMARFGWSREDIEELEALGVIEFTTAGNSKRPILRDGTEAIDLSITFPTDTDRSNSKPRQETSA